MKQRRADKWIYAVLNDLKACTSKKDLLWGRRIHERAVDSGNVSNMYVATALIRMYAKCGCVVDARRVFDSTLNPDVACWTALLLGYAANGEGKTALGLFSEMKTCGCAPDFVTYIAAFKACTSLAINEIGKLEALQRGRQLHSEITGWKIELPLQNTLIDMYSKCGSMVDAQRVFDGIPKPDVVSWTNLLLGYTENGNELAALEIFTRMKRLGCAPDGVTYVGALKSCASLAVNGNDSRKRDCLQKGMEIHTEIGCNLNLSVQNTLVDMYSKCGSMVYARQVFDSIRKPNVVSWNVLLLGYAENGQGRVALELFSRMKAIGYVPDSVTFVAAIKACTSLTVSGDASTKEDCLKLGREIHSEGGSCLNPFLQNTLVDMYAKCGRMVDAREVFENIRKPDVVSWTSLILGYAENGDGHTSLDLFLEMKISGRIPDSVAYVAALKACISLSVKGEMKLCLERGRELHSEIGWNSDNCVQSTLIAMYAKCGCMVDARCVFDSIRKPDVVSWTNLILGYADNGEAVTALDLYSKMKARVCTPDCVTYMAVLKACTILAAIEDGIGKARWLERGREIHSEIGPHMDYNVQITLIDMYAKAGSMVDARSVFEGIQKPDVVAWNVVLMGYVDNGHGLTALDMFARMKSFGCVPDTITHVAALKACCLEGALALGRKFHLEIKEFNTQLITCLIDFYAKCGSMIEAREVFDNHPDTRDIATWNALLAGYASVDISSSLGLFESMQEQGYRPDSITFLTILLGYNHAGLVEKAKTYFEVMIVKFGVIPGIRHYNCMVDMLGRANQLSEAISMMQKMPCVPDAVAWTTLLGACRKWRNLEIGTLAFQSLVDMDRRDSSVYVLMAHIHDSTVRAW